MPLRSAERLRRHRWRTALTLLVVTAVALLGACSGDDGGAPSGATSSSGPGGSSATSGTGTGSSAAPKEATRPFTVLNSYEVTDIDPARSGASWLWDFGAAETLTTRADDGSLQPLVAASWEQRDPLTWVFTLRDGVTFQNGKPVTADIVARAMTRQVAELTAAKTALPGATFTATGPLELTVATPAPNAWVPEAMAERTPFAVYDVDTVQPLAGDNAALLGTGYLTGPYAPTGFSAEELTLTRYDGYWGGRPPLPGVVVKRVLNEQSRLLAVQSGEADLALYAPIEAKRTLEGRDDAHFKASSLALQSVLMDLNQGSTPFDDVAVRKAFATAIDYRELAEDVMDSVFEQGTGLYPPGFVDYAVEDQATDHDASAELLDEAGWVRDGGGVRAKAGQPLQVKLLRAAQDPETATLATAMQAQLAEQGWDVEIVSSEDFMTVQKDLEAWDATLYLNGTLSTAGSPLPALQRKFVTGGENNIGGVSDPEIDALAAELLQTADEGRRDEIMRRIQEITVEEQSYFVVSSFKRFAVVSGVDYPDYEVSNFRRHVTPETAPA